jgi:hypothetical protein
MGIGFRKNAGELAPTSWKSLISYTSGNKE